MTPETTTKAAPAARIDGPDSACLILIYGGPELGRRYELTQETRIGREPDNDICIDLSHVSRSHARLACRDHKWFVADLGSTNGTQVNGVDVLTEQELDNGDLIKVGGTIFKYIAGGNIEALFHEEIYRMTIFDGLTRIHNKRYFLDFLEREMARSRRYGSLLSLAMFDIDHFKKINDTYGHPAGDHVLEKVAHVVGQLVRREQLFARYGGEEFALVLPELAPREVLAFCESARQNIENETFEFAGEKIKVTISVGAATLNDSMTREELIAAADTQLYEAKRGGRNRVVAAIPALTSAPPNRRAPGDL